MCVVLFSDQLLLFLFFFTGGPYGPQPVEIQGFANHSPTIDANTLHQTSWARKRPTWTALIKDLGLGCAFFLYSSAIHRAGISQLGMPELYRSPVLPSQVHRKQSDARSQQSIIPWNALLLLCFLWSIFHRQLQSLLLLILPAQHG